MTASRTDRSVLLHALGVALVVATLLGLLFALQAHLGAALTGRSIPRGYLGTFLIQSPPWWLWALFVPVVFIVLDRIGVSRFRPLPTLGAHALLGLLLAGAHSFVMTWLEWFFLPTIQAPSPWALFRFLLAVRTPSNVIDYALIAVVYHVLEHVRALRASREEVRNLMSRRFDAVRHLAGGLAHQLNNQLVAVKAGAELALESLPPGHPTREELEGVGLATRSIERVAAELRTLGRGEVLRPADTPVDEVLAILAAAVDPWVEAVEREPPGDVPPVLVDADHLRGVIRTLGGEVLGRAGVEVGTATVRQAGSAEVPSELQGVLAPAARRRVQVEVDVGGELPVDPETLFEPRFQVEGAGVGPRLRAAAARAVMIQMGGWLDVHRREDALVFELWLKEV